jgi:hypothetical protein
VEIEEFTQAEIKPKMSNKKNKIILICFLDIRYIIHFEFLPEGTTVIQTFYMESLKSSIDSVRRKRGRLRTDRSLSLRHENAPAYYSLLVPQCLAGKGIPAADNLPYAPDLAPAAFWLFRNSKSVRKGKRFSEVEDIGSFVKKMYYLLY